MMSNSPYKPSPLSFGSPRSPFRRPETPTSPSTVRASSPQTSPTRQNGNNSITLSPRVSNSPRFDQQHQSPLPARTAAQQSYDTKDNLSKLAPAQARELRDAFQTLDRDGDGQVGRDDVTDMLTNLAQNPNAAPFFPPGAHQTMSLPAYLTILSGLLAPLSASAELSSAFAAFDEDDSGQVDVSELRDALLHAAPESGVGWSERDLDRAFSGFTGRRAFDKHSAGKNKGDVLRYQEFVTSISGGGATNSGKQDEG